MKSAQQIFSESNIAGPCTHKPADARCMKCILDSSDYFSALSLEVKRALQQFLLFKSYDRRTLLYREGGPGANLFILLSGEVKIYKSLPGGRQQIHKLANIPGDLIACEDLFLDRHAVPPRPSRRLACAFCKITVAGGHEPPLLFGSLLRFMARDLNSYIRTSPTLARKKPGTGWSICCSCTKLTMNASSAATNARIPDPHRTGRHDRVTQALIRCLKKLETDNSSPDQGWLPHSGPEGTGDLSAVG